MAAVFQEHRSCAGVHPEFGAAGAVGCAPDHDGGRCRRGDVQVEGGDDVGRCRRNEARGFSTGRQAVRCAADAAGIRLPAAGGGAPALQGRVEALEGHPLEHRGAVEGEQTNVAGAVRGVSSGDHRGIAVRVQQVRLPAHGELPAVGRHPQPVHRVGGDPRGVGAQGGVVLDPVQPQPARVGVHFGRVTGGSGSVGAEQDGTHGMGRRHLDVGGEVRDLRGLAGGDGPDVGAVGSSTPETRGGGGPTRSVGQPAADVGVDGADPGLAEVHCAVVGVEPHMAVLVPLVRGVDPGYAVHCHVDPRSVHVDVHRVAPPGIQRDCRGRRHILTGGQGGRGHHGGGQDGTCS